MNVEAVCISDRKGISKTPVGRAAFEKDHGIKGDAHAGPGPRQVSILLAGSLKRMGKDIRPGDCAENLLISGIDLQDVHVGMKWGIADVVLEISQIGKPCHTRCAVYHRLGKCLMPTEGVFARVLQSGTIKPGDDVFLI
jgi:molybdopterin adenylyltransferase